MKLPKDYIVKIIKACNRELDIQNGLNVSLGRVHKNKKIYNRKVNKQQMKKEFTGLTW